MTWSDEPSASTPLSGDARLAAYANRTVINQADKEWCHHPTRRPTTLVPPEITDRICPQLGRILLSDYGTEIALNSRRRHETGEVVTDLVERKRTKFVS